MLRSIIFSQMQVPFLLELNAKCNAAIDGNFTTLFQFFFVKKSNKHITTIKHTRNETPPIRILLQQPAADTVL